jgi:predicted nucleic acid-binding protein
MILIDSNIPMYLVGGSHPNKPLARQLLESLVIQGESLVTDAEVLQEILHRYTAIARRDAIGPAFEAILGVVDDVLPIERKEVETARRLLETIPRLSARDAVHVAVMQQHGIERVMSFDSGFDGIPGIERVAS